MNEITVVDACSTDLAHLWVYFEAKILAVVWTYFVKEMKSATLLLDLLLLSYLYLNTIVLYVFLNIYIYDHTYMYMAYYN